MSVALHCSTAAKCMVLCAVADVQITLQTSPRLASHLLQRDVRCYATFREIPATQGYTILPAPYSWVESCNGRILSAAAPMQYRQSQRGAAKFSNAFISPLYPAVRSTWPKVGPAEIAASPAAVASAASSRFSPLPLLRIVSLANDSARPDACAIRHTVSCIYLVLSCIKLQALTLC